MYTHIWTAHAVEPSSKDAHAVKPSSKDMHVCIYICMYQERWGAGVETQKNVRGVFGGWGRVPFNEPYTPLLSTTYDGA